MEVVMMLLLAGLIIGTSVLVCFTFADLYYQVVKFRKIARMKAELEEKLLSTILEGEKVWKV